MQEPANYCNSRHSDKKAEVRRVSPRKRASEANASPFQGSSCRKQRDCRPFAFRGISKGERLRRLFRIFCGATKDTRRRHKQCGKLIAANSGTKCHAATKELVKLKFENKGSMSIVGVEVKENKDGSCRGWISGTILCITEEDSFSEIREVSHAKTEPFQYFCLVVTAFNKAI